MSADFTTGNLDPDAFTTPEEQAAIRDAGETPRPGARHADPDLAALFDDSPATPADDLDDLRSELSQDLDNTTTLPVEGRERYTVRFRTDFTGKELDKLRQTSRDKSFADKIDGPKFGALLIATTCLAVLRDGKPIPLESGREATFMEPEFLDLLKRDADGRAPIKAVTAIQRFYGGDGKVDAQARKLMEIAGWGDEVAEADPTA